MDGNILLPTGRTPWLAGSDFIKIIISARVLIYSLANYTSSLLGILKIQRSFPLIITNDRTLTSAKRNGLSLVVERIIFKNILANPKIIFSVRVFIVESSRLKFHKFHFLNFIRYSGLKLQKCSPDCIVR